MLSIFDGFGTNLKNFFFPLDEFCMFCKKRTKPYKHYLCEECYSNLYEIEYACKFCGEILDRCGIEICRDCMQARGSYEKIISAYKLDENTKRAVYAYKNGRERSLSFCFASILEESIRKNFDLDLIDLIVPVPTSKEKYKTRGFDHVSDICKHLSESLGVRYYNLLVKVKDENEQKSLNKEERFINIKDNFAIKNKLKMPINVLLVDDIITTGVTITACSDLLYSSGASVYVCSVFR